MKRLGALILAAGISSRMGAFKPLLPLDGESMLLRCAGMMSSAGAERIVVVTGHRREDIEKSLEGRGVCFVHNEHYASSQMFDSLRLGLRELEGACERVLISPVDVPAVSAETVKRLLDCGGRFVRPVYKGRAGHPVVLDAAAIPAICAYGGEGGLRGAVSALGIEVCNVETGEERACLDADTPEDYRYILSLKGGRK